MLKLITGFILVIFTFVNLAMVIYIYGLKTYKIEGSLPSFYKYTLLESKIKEDFETLKGQNILVEKGSNRIIKVENYNITGETVITGTLMRESKGSPVSFENDTVISLSKDYSDIKSITIERLGTKVVDSFLVLTPSQINSLVQKKDFIDGEFPKLF